MRVHFTTYSAQSTSCQSDSQQTYTVEITSERFVEKLVQVGHVADASDDFAFHLNISLYTECIHHLQPQHKHYRLINISTILLTIMQ